MNNVTFQQQMLLWFDQHGRHNLPWQTPITPYRTWLSEIMLQQTQVDTVIPYFKRFVDTFPTIEDLAGAPQDTVLHLWTGLGYYARARNLHKCAKLVVENYDGQFPSELEQLQALPGIGPSTAAAIASIAFNKPTAILDGNVKRVLARHFAVEGWPGNGKVERKLWEHSHALMPKDRCRDYTQAMMDLGATLCTRSRPQCDNCPINSHCIAFAQGNPQDYPGKKPKKVIPTKPVDMLILTRESQYVLLEKRPDSGIWSGLWSLPEADDKEGIITLGINRFGCTLKTQSFAKLKHTFSHYHLEIHAHTAQLDSSAQPVMDSSHQIWYNLNQPQSIGLAAPIKKLLESYKQSHLTHN